MEEKNLIDFFFGSLFTQGLALGLFFCIVIYIRGFLRRRELTKEVGRLRSLGSAEVVGSAKLS